MAGRYRRYINTKEPYFAQIRKLIPLVMLGSHKSRHAVIQERTAYAGNWLGPEMSMPHTMLADAGMGGGLQEGHGQAT